MVRLGILALLFVLEGPTASAFLAATWGRQALGATTPSSLSASASETSGRRRRATTMMARGRGKKARELAKLEALNGPPPLELSRPMELEKLSRGRTLSITATEEEMAKLSERFNLAGISKFEASLAVAAGSVKRGLSLKGTLEAELRQVCVVSGEEFTAPLEAEFECTLIEGDETAVAARLSEDLGEVDLEFVEDGVAELGEITAQYFALEIDPYPRAPEGGSMAVVDAIVEKQKPKDAAEGLADSWTRSPSPKEVEKMPESERF